VYRHAYPVDHYSLFWRQEIVKISLQGRQLGAPKRTQDYDIIGIFDGEANRFEFFPVLREKTWGRAL